MPAVLVTGKVNGVENGRAGNGYAVNGASYVNGATRVNGISPAGYPPVVSEAINGAVVNGAVAVPAGCAVSAFLVPAPIIVQNFTAITVRLTALPSNSARTLAMSCPRGSGPHTQLDRTKA